MDKILDKVIKKQAELTEITGNLATITGLALQMLPAPPPQQSTVHCTPPPVVSDSGLSMPLALTPRPKKQKMVQSSASLQLDVLTALNTAKLPSDVEIVDKNKPCPTDLMSQHNIETTWQEIERLTRTNIVTSTTITQLWNLIVAITSVLLILT
ncbi:hypothetical protein C0995_010938 [Termitomyces sp. Mi166|nr:hypothetical protein C0995_010938 [Termitomyces sp. Mi166\